MVAEKGLYPHASDQEIPFIIGTKNLFEQWPEIVQQFLADNGLTSGRFMYNFSDFVFTRGTRSKACDRILKDSPGMGDIRVDEGVHGRDDTCWVSNIDGETFTEGLIRPMMNKIHRSYRFVDSCLYYYDIDFFGSVKPYERDFSVARRRCERDGIPYDPTKDIAWQPRGSGITLYRDGAFDKAWMEMTVDLLRDGKVMDSAPYKQALRLLPKMKVEETMEILLSEEEQQHIACLNEGAEEMLERCRSYLKERLWRE